jgi:predicted phage baseplate assembly protein
VTGTALDTCGCEPRSPAAPRLYNRPGLAELAYRIGTHPAFLDRMFRALAVPREDDDGTPLDLTALTTRAPDDPSIGLLDAFAVVADVLAFYEERIANEGFLRTATERRSLLELARTIGYELSPGVAASTYFKFAVEDRSAPVAGQDPSQLPPTGATIAAGTPVKSIPGQDELPQTFETSAELAARGDWNEMHPRLSRPAVLDATVTSLYLEGTLTGLKPGDLMLLFDDAKQKRVVQVGSVTPQPDEDRTAVAFVADTPNPVQPYVWEPTTVGEIVFGGFYFGGLYASEAYLSSWSDESLGVYMSVNDWPVYGFLDYAAAQPLPAPAVDAQSGVFAFRQTAASFGNNAQQFATLPQSVKDAFGSANNWDDSSPPHVFEDSKGNTLNRTASGNDDVVQLDMSYPRIERGSWVALVKNGRWESASAYLVARTEERSVADFALSGKVTALQLEDEAGAQPADQSTFTFRDTSILAQSERLELAPVPIDPVFEGATGTLELDRMVLGWSVGQPLAISGERADLPGVVQTEVTHLSAATHGGGTTTLEFDPLANDYLLATIAISANVAAATHGETVADEVLGSSNGGANQRFTLQRKPLTYVSSSDGSGTASTLELRVDGLLWHEVPSLYGLGPADRSFVVRRDDDGTAHVVFGDGTMGARPPSGTENVRATYRIGVGSPGLVGEGKISLLTKRPLGVRGVLNPMPTAGAADPESRDSARDNAPLTVLTLDRIVSLSDYEDFARGFAGVGKASSVGMFDGEDELVHVTVVGPEGALIDELSDTFAHLASAIETHHDPGRRYLLASTKPLYFYLVADVVVDPDYEAATVIGAVKDALAERFSFTRRAFGQGVSEAEAIETILSVAGTLDTNVSGLDLLVSGAEPDPPAKVDPLLADLARATSTDPLVVAPPQLLVLTPAGARIEERAA